MDEQYYALYLDDPATPSYCSFDKLYVGTKEELDVVISVMRQDERYNTTVAACEAYWKQDGGATHYVAFREVPILTPVRRICSSQLEFGTSEWEHINVWGFPYKMRFDHANVKQLLIEHEKQYYRLLRAKFTNLCYESVIGTWVLAADGFWGHGCLLDVKHLPGGSVTLESLLYMEQDHFENASDADDLMLDPSKVFFDRICDEIFADG